MNLILIVIIFLFCIKNISVNGEENEQILKYFRIVRLLATNEMLRINRRHLGLIRNNSRLQPLIPETTPFPCSLEHSRSPEIPTSVHQLRPGDIDVIGVLGDSLSVGFGLLATNPLEILLEERGLSFGGGGQGSWRKYLTVPNILKEFNPNLVGYSLGPSLSIQKDSQFNAAEGGAISRNTPYMAKILIKRIQNDPRVNFTKDWKMVTYMIGDNDFCSVSCYQNPPEQILEEHRRDLLQVLRLLRDNLPRTIVNIIPPFNPRLLVEANIKMPYCHYISHSMDCPCLFGLQFRHLRQRLYDVIDEWWAVEDEVANLDEFDLDNFTVVLQTFSMDFSAPLDRYGEMDLSFLSHDCFHFSQKGNALIANHLWNDLLEPIGEKLTRGEVRFLKKFNCPSKEKPYIYTRRNSVVLNGTSKASSES